MQRGLVGTTTPSGLGEGPSVSPSPDTLEPALQNVDPEGSFLQRFLGSNPYFSAGFGLMGVGVGLTLLRRGSVLLSTVIQRRLLVSLEIPSKDHSYNWFLEWMATQSKLPANSPSVIRMRSHQLSVETNFKQHQNGSSEAFFSLVPGPGTHWFKYRGAWMQVKRERDTKMIDMTQGTPWETVTLTTLSRDRALFPQLLAEAREIATRGNQGKLVIYIAWGAEWKPFGQPRRKRELSSVVLDAGLGERIESDVKEFLARGKWYAERGIPYRRGYLLYGPPGSGKSSFIQALAGKLSYNICLLNLSQRGLMDDKLNHLLMNAPERSFILLEDVDAAFNKRLQTSDDGYQSSVTFSGLLNALDGVASSEERIIFMTTNHLHRLDDALVRPGRVDMLEKFDDATPAQAKALFMRFYGGDDTTKAEIEELANSVEGIVAEDMKHHKRVSMASLQGHFIRNTARTAVSSCNSLFVSRLPAP